MDLDLCLGTLKKSQNMILIGIKEVGVLCSSVKAATSQDVPGKILGIKLVVLSKNSMGMSCELDTWC